jgi:hypothetical protein
MAITAISRDFGALDPNIVRIVSTDTLATITAAGYLAAQATNIAALINGAFQWKTDDTVLISYNGGSGFFTYDSLNALLVVAGAGVTQVRVTSAQILGMYATPVLMIPAPGTGKQIILTKITGTYLFGTAAYAAGGAIGLERANTAHLAGPAASNTLAGATFDGYVASNNFELTPDNTDTVANITGAGIWLSNDTAAFTTGDGTLLMTISYNVAAAA